MNNNYLIQLTPPFTIDKFVDGGCYQLPESKYQKTNLFFEITTIGEIYIKIPSRKAEAFHKTFLMNDIYPSRPIRYAEGIELASRFDEAIEAFSEFEHIFTLYEKMSIDLSEQDIRRIVHFLIVCRVQYERLCLLNAIPLPESRFVFFVRSGKKSPVDLEYSTDLIPAIIQTKIHGTRLWEMYDPAIGFILPQWQPYLLNIASQLYPLLQPDYVEFFDWNPKNFLYNQTTQKLHYVDSKPTTYAGKKENDHNLVGIRKYYQI